MAIRRKHRKAEQIFDSLRPEETRRLRSRCEFLRVAQYRLRAEASRHLPHCGSRCGGLCCRNVRIEDLFDVADFLYLRVLAEPLAPRVARRVRRAPPIFPADCTFLEDGRGPCILPDGVRPRICIVSYCTEAPAPVRRAAADVEAAFDRVARWALPGAALLRRLGRGSARKES